MEEEQRPTGDSVLEQRVNQCLSSNMRTILCNFFLKNNHSGVLQKGAISEAAEPFGVHRKTIYMLWKEATKMMENGKPAIMVHKVIGYNMEKRRAFMKKKLENNIGRWNQSLELAKPHFIGG